MMRNLFYKQGEIELEYIKYGSGEKVLLAFHGFGKHAEDFEVFEDKFGSKYTIFAFNLFHHGNSKYPENRILSNSISKDELKSIFKGFLDQKKITHFGVMGYSLGGKIALMFPEFFADRITEIWLFAPDGIKMNFWYYFASKTWLGRSVYKYVLDHPSFFISMVNNLNRIGIINDKLKKFALNNMDNREKRELVYRVWLTFKNTNPNMNMVIKNIRSNKIPVYQFFGKSDKVIVPKLGEWFSSEINQEENFHILPMGHNLLTSRTINYISSLKLFEF